MNTGCYAKVTGDRGSGKYLVQLLDRYTGPSVMDEETVYYAKIIMMEENPYHYKVGDVVYVVKQNFTDKTFYGRIDPFVNKPVV